MSRTLIAAVLTLFLAAGLAPVVLGEEPQESQTGTNPDSASPGNEPSKRDDRKELKEDRQEIKEDRKELKEDRKEYREDLRESKAKYGPRQVRGNVSLDVSGSAVGKDNATYTFTLRAVGKGVEQVKVQREDNQTAYRYHAKLSAHIVVKDVNGTVVKEGDFRVQLMARGQGNETRWQLVSMAKRDNGLPKLVLRGEAEKAAVGTFDLVGKGRAVFKVCEIPAVDESVGAEPTATACERAKVPVKISEAKGTLTFVPTPHVAKLKPKPATAAPVVMST